MLQDGGRSSSQIHKAPHRRRTELLGKLEKAKCPLMGHLTRDLVGTLFSAHLSRCWAVALGMSAELALGGQRSQQIKCCLTPSPRRQR